MPGEITSYFVKTNIWQKRVVKYRCPGCNMDLQSPLAEAGTEQSCPSCYMRFTTPGMKELAAEKTEKKAATHESATALAKWHASPHPERPEPAPPPIEHVYVRPVPKPPPPPPELLWYGRMACHACGYQWKSKRNTPPMKCAGCGSRNIVVVREPRRPWYHGFFS